eukprot:a176328_409.p1 GENE.a176328_409~~a176328_409.p1  ORF type:complete len:237 (-),score=97.20 a176328_409:78-749(-)
MPILYAMIARAGPTVLTDYATTPGNQASIAAMIAGKVNFSANDRRSYSYSGHTFHFVVSSGLLFLAMSTEDTKVRLGFGLLVDLQNRFEAKFRSASQWQNAAAFELNSSFQRELQDRVTFFNNDPAADKLASVQAQIADVKGIMVENIEKVLQRGERIELLVEKTDTLNAQAATFKKKSTQLKRAMWWKNMRLWLIIGLVAAIALWFLLSLICGFDFSKCKKK